MSSGEQNPDSRPAEPTSALFPNGISFTDSDRQLLLEQYKLLVNTSESLVSRRQTANTFFLSFNSVFLSGIGLLFKPGISGQPGTVGVLALSISGILVCVAWIRLVRSYRQLNSGKFEVINQIEQHLPASMFCAEWDALGQGKDDKTYRPFTKTEQIIPVVFGILYGARSRNCFRC